MKRFSCLAAVTALTLATSNVAEGAAPCPIRNLIGSWQMAVVQTDSNDYTEHLTCYLDIWRRGRDRDAAHVIIDCKNMCIGCGSWYSEPKEFDLYRSQSSSCAWVIRGGNELRFVFGKDFGIAQGEIGLAVASTPFYALNTSTLIKLGNVPQTHE
jgi:hypothetical protein